MARGHETVDVFRAIADPTRRRLLDLLLAHDMAAQDLANRFDMSFPAISQHLSVLRDAGLVRMRPDGQRRVYRAEPRRLRRVHEWAAQYQRFWSGRLRRFGRYLDRSAASSRPGSQ